MRRKIIQNFSKLFSKHDKINKILIKYSDQKQLLKEFKNQEDSRLNKKVKLIQKLEIKRKLDLFCKHL
jgi:hypothetical protein